MSTTNRSKTTVALTKRMLTLPLHRSMTNHNLRLPTELPLPRLVSVVLCCFGWLCTIVDTFVIIILVVCVLEHNAPEVKETVSIGEELTYCESGTSSMSDSNGRTNGGDEAEKDVPEAKQAEQLVNNQSQDEQVAKLDTTATEPMFSPVVASTPNNLSTFSRSSTLNRSQRRKILPQVNIKNLIITSDAFSPPPAADVNPGLLTKDEPSEATATNSATAASSANGHKEPEENFIVSSQQQNENNKSVMLDPLRALSDASSLNSSGNNNRRWCNLLGQVFSLAGFGSSIACFH